MRGGGIGSNPDGETFGGGRGKLKTL